MNPCVGPLTSSNWIKRALIGTDGLEPQGIAELSEDLKHNFASHSAWRQHD